MADGIDFHADDELAEAAGLEDAGQGRRRAAIGKIGDVAAQYAVGILEIGIDDEEIALVEIEADVAQAGESGVIEEVARDVAADIGAIVIVHADETIEIATSKNAKQPHFHDLAPPLRNARAGTRVRFFPIAKNVTEVE